MLQKIVSASFALEGLILLAAGLGPGAEEIFQDLLRRFPQLLTAEQAGQAVSMIDVAQRVGIVLGVVCLAAGMGVGRRTGWGRAIHVAASVGNLPLIPFLTPLGVAGLFVEFQGERAEVAEEEAGLVPVEKPQPASQFLVMAASVALIVGIWNWIRGFAETLGLPAPSTEGLGMAWIVTGQLGFTLFHEIGHVLAAKMVGFRSREVRVGPFKLARRQSGGWVLRFDWQRMIITGGHLRAVPASERELRMNWILIVAAGPAAALFAGMMGLLMVVSLPGTPYADLWTWAAFVSAVALADCVANLLPLGMTDGAMLIHTAFGTRRGKGILAGLRAAMLNEAAESGGEEGENAERQEARRKALEELAASQEASGLALALQRVGFAEGSLREGFADEAAEALREAGEALENLKSVSNAAWFRYWHAVHETAAARRQHLTAADARERALEKGALLWKDLPVWEESAPVRLRCARLRMADGDFAGAAAEIEKTRSDFPGRKAVSALSVALVATECECQRRLGDTDAAEALAETAIEIARQLPDGEKITAMEALAQMARRVSDTGQYGFAGRVFAAAVTTLEALATPAVAARCRGWWAEALYENGKLDEAKSVLEALEAGSKGAGVPAETLRARLLLAEDRPREAAEILQGLLAGADEAAGASRKLELAGIGALRAWALYRAGSAEEARAAARGACDELMLVEHPAAAPALLTLGVDVEEENSALAEVYVQEASRLICEAQALSPVGKASRLTDLARMAVQSERVAWGKRLLDQAAKVRAAKEGPA